MSLVGVLVQTNKVETFNDPATMNNLRHFTSSDRWYSRLLHTWNRKSRYNR